MSVPSLTVSVNSSGITVTPAGSGNVPLIIGTCSSGPYAEILGVSNPQNLTTVFGQGPAVDAAALDFTTGAPEVLLYRVFAGSVGSTVQNPSVGSGTIAFTGNPTAPFGTITSTGSTGIIVEISVSSVTSTTPGDFIYSLDGGVTYSASIPIPVGGGTYLFPNTGITATFTGAETTGVWVAADKYIAPITANVGQMAGYGQAVPTGTQIPLPAMVQTNANGVVGGNGLGTIGNNNGSPLDSYQVVIEITKSGTVTAPGTPAQFIASLDGGQTFSNPLTVATGVSLGGGVNISMSDAGGGGAVTGMQAGDTYQFRTLAPQFSSIDIGNVLTDIENAPSTWGWVHIAGQANTVSTSPSSGFSITQAFPVCDSAASTWFAAGRCEGALILFDAPSTTDAQNIDSSLVSGTAALASDYVSVGAGTAATYSSATQQDLARGPSFDVSARMSIAPIGQDPAWVGAGPLSGIVDLYYTTAQNSTLDNARFSTLTTINGVQGTYITDALIMSANTSNFTDVQYRRVMNRAAQATRSVLTPFLSQSVRLLPNGNINPIDLNNIINQVTGAINAAVVTPGAASGVVVSVQNTLGAGGVLLVTIGLIPLGYIKHITATLGFQL